jgi:hypothetical protein
VPSAAVFHPERLVAVLGRFKVRYVLIGSVAARLHGFPWLVAIAEIAPAADAANREALATALAHLGARIYTDGTPDGLPFEFSSAALAQGAVWQLITSCGRLDVHFDPPGSGGYDAMAKSATKFELHGDMLLTAPLEAVAKMKEASGRISDRQEASAMRLLAQEPSALQTSLDSNS